MFYFSPYLLLPFFSSLVTGTLAFYLFRRRKEPATPHVLFLMFLLSLWSGAFGLQIAATEIGLKVLFYKIGTTCAYLAAPTFLVIAMEASGFSHWLTRRRLLLIVLAPFATLLSAWTTEFHSLNRFDLHVVQSGILLLLGYKAGPLYLLHYLYIAAIFLFSMVLLAVGFMRGRGAYRQRSLLLFIGTLAPMSVEYLNITPHKLFSLASSTFWFSGLCYTLAIFRYRLLDLLPVARSVLFENLGEPILILDSLGRIADSNSAARRLFESGSKRDAAAQLEAALERFPVLARVVNSSAAPFLEIVTDRIKGDRYWQIKAVPLRREDYFLGTLVQFYDVTALKRSEETLRAAHKAAEEANRVKSDFLATVSHELRTPLQAIIGFSELARKLDDPHRTAEYLAIINEASMTLLDLVNNILDLSRMEAGAMELAVTPLDLHGLLRSLVVIHAHKAKEKGIAFSLIIDEDVPQWITGDPMKIRQILTNIIGNAVKFTDHGEVTIKVTVPPSPGGREQAAGVNMPFLFTIKDTGIGIPEAKKGLVFESFAQGDSNITRRYGGSGLGTAIARRLARMMGGDITFASREGKGSIFVVELPLTDAVELKEDFEAVEQTSTGRRLMILLAEDNLLNQRLLLDALALSGHTISTALDGREALAKYRDGRFDLVFMDIMMPDMDGCEAARHIRACEAEQGRERTPIVAVSADTSVSVRERCLSAGMDDVLAKPLTMFRLNDYLDRFYGAAVFRGENTRPLIYDGAGLFDPAKLGGIAGDPRRLASYCGLLLADFDRELGRLPDALAAHDRRAIERAAHAIRGAALPLSGSSVSALAERLQTLAETGSEDQLADGIARLRDASELLCTTLRKVSRSS